MGIGVGAYGTMLMQRQLAPYPVRQEQVQADFHVIRNDLGLKPILTRDDLLRIERAGLDLIMRDGRAYAHYDLAQPFVAMHRTALLEFNMGLTPQESLVVMALQGDICYPDIEALERMLSAARRLKAMNGRGGQILKGFGIAYDAFGMMVKGVKGDTETDMFSNPAGKPLFVGDIDRMISFQESYINSLRS